MHSLRAHLRYLRQRQVVRPWALAVPILVLAFTLPLLRPLRHPVSVAREETVRLTTINSIVQRGTIHVPEAMLEPREMVVIDNYVYAQQPPALALLLSGPYWVMHQFGYTLENNSALVVYLLTLIGVTLPVALGVGLVYRMGRLFELARPMRALLALLVAFASGLVSYATVLNSHAPAGALVLASAALLIQVAIQQRVLASMAWLIPCGALATLAAFMEPPAWVFVILFLFVVLAIRWKVSVRLLAALVYAVGCGAIVALHVWIAGPDLTYATTIPAPIQALHADLTNTRLPAPELAPKEFDDFEEESAQGDLFRNAGRLVDAVLGGHGLLSHFPALLLGLVGIAAVMHRHWPASTKVFAMATAGGSLAILVGCVIWIAPWRVVGFAMPWFVVFTPLLLFWMGAWLRRPHRPRSWVIAGCLLGFSAVVTMIGALHPLPRDGYEGYTPIAVVRELTRTSQLPSDLDGLAEARAPGQSR